MAFKKLSTNDLPIDNVPGAPQPEDNPNKQTIDPQKSALPAPYCTKDKGSLGGSWSGKYGWESLWQSNWIMQ